MRLAFERNDFFEVVAPPEWSLPIVLNSPHSGDRVPESLLRQSRLTAAELRKSEDRYVDELFEGCIALGAPMLRARLSRSFIDLNREPFELDPRMFDTALPAYMNASSPRIVAGLGTIPRTAGDGEQIYRQKLQLDEVLRRIEQVYYPYHRALTDLLNHVHVQTGQVYLIDCHSMPPSAMGLEHERHKQVDVVIGDRFGASCSPECVDLWREGLTAAGLRVKMNHPYPGGFITESHGHPRMGRHAIQIEINRGLYMHPVTLEKTKNFKPMQEAIKAVFELFGDQVSNGSGAAACKAAAE